MIEKNFELLDELEKRRVKLRRRYITMSTVLFLLFFPLYASYSLIGLVPLGKKTISFLKYAFLVLSVISILGSICSLIIGSRKLKEIKIILFRDVFKPTVEATLKGCRYDHDTGLQYETIADSLIVPPHDRFSSSDLIDGKEDGVSFIQSSVILEKEERDRDRSGNIHKSYFTSFSGIFIVFSLPKVIKEQIVISDSINFLRGFNEIKSNKADFDKAFKIFSKSEADTFTILTQELMEAIVKIKNAYSGSVSLSFYKNQLVLGIDEHKPRFFISLKLPINEQIYKEIEEDASLIKDIVKTLKLNDSIF